MKFNSTATVIVKSAIQGWNEYNKITLETLILLWKLEFQIDEYSILTISFG